MKRVFLLGYPISHSLSPAMHNAAFRAVDLNWRYELLETPQEKLHEALARLRADDCGGANVTLPHKQAVMEYLDELSDTARAIGAVNTIVVRDGRLIGDNTDAVGFIAALRDARVDPRNVRVVIIGAGGAARAVAFALAERGAASIDIVNRTTSRATMLAEALRQHFPHLALGVNMAEALKDAHIIVNATSVGMSPNADESPMPRGCVFPRGAVAFDLVYRPMQTQFLRDAEKAGARPIGGLGMLVHQGGAAFKLWTGYEAPVQVMFNAALNALK